MKIYLYGGILAALLLAFGASNWYSHHTGYAAAETAGNARIDTLKAEYAQATAKAEADARAKEHAAATRMVAIQQTYYQQGVTDANAKADAVITDLRAGTLRLRKQWRGCQATANVPQAAASAGKPDAVADERSQGARDLVRIAAAADAQIRALQAVVKADRQ